ncbi:MAG: TolC family protein [Bdellovibrionales bacterium]|nr:TolC family protein [Bdellovibrionales bacterium]
MKKLIITGFLLLSCNVFAEIYPVTLEEVTAKVTKDNYFVLENAQRVYQAKESVQLARKNLLPKLNIWNVVESASNGPLGLIGIVADVAPFLVPNNWFRVGEEKLFAEATTNGYRALWANELLTARGLVLQSGLDERLIEQVEANAKDLESISSMVRSREAMGTIPAGSVKQFEVRQISVAEEIRGLSKVIKENRSQLAYLLGLPGNSEAIPNPVDYIDPASAKPLSYSDYEARMTESSFELKQYDALLKAADKEKKGRYFNFLGTSTLSRSTGGSVFDGLPQQDGLGFGLGPSVRIVKSQKKILEIQREAVRETLKKNLKVLVESFNFDLMSREDALKKVEKTNAIWKLLADRVRLGANVPVFDLVEASRTRVEAISTYHSVETRLLLGLDRLNRLTYQDAYRIAEGPLP